MRLKRTGAVLLTALCVFTIIFTIGCGRGTNSDASEISLTEVEEDPIVIGFSQLGAESDWRCANTESMKSTFCEENGYQLIFEDGQQEQSNQITSIRRFIQQEVDYIVLAPVTETGWDSVLQEAKDAGIPVIIVDRMIDVSDESLFTSWVGSNFELEGKKAAAWLKEFCYKNAISSSNLHIVDIQGTIGSSAQIGRTKGLTTAAEDYGWDIVAFEEGEFTQAKGREAMNRLLAKNDNINVVYCENDNEAIGVIESLEANGYKVGSDIKNGQVMVISFDGVNEEALSDVIDDKISLIVECNPLHGPRVESIIKMLEAGDDPEKYTYVEESLICANNQINKISVDGALYQLTPFNEDQMKKRLANFK